MLDRDVLRGLLLMRPGFAFSMIPVYSWHIIWASARGEFGINRASWGRNGNRGKSGAYFGVVCVGRVSVASCFEICQQPSLISRNAVFFFFLTFATEIYSSSAGLPLPLASNFGYVCCCGVRGGSKRQAGGPRFSFYIFFFHTYGFLLPVCV